MNRSAINLPTWITISRLLGVPIMLYGLQAPTIATRWILVGVFLVVAGTDWLDGYLARRLNQVTELGKFLDPLVDKLMVLAPLMSLVELGQIPAWGVFLILARELTIAGWRVSPSMQSGAVPGANLAGKIKTVVQIVAIALLIAPLSDSRWGIGMFWLSVLATWVSGAMYLLPQRRGI
jgi:CDP-diacylglycerol---glycerol-3-phosphate 3-phosphatidyltransferase